MRVSIYTDEARGCVIYTPYTKEVEVHHPDVKVRKRVYRFLTSPQTIRTGDGSGRKGAFKEREIMPTDSCPMMELALCTMNAKIGIHVDWSDPDNNNHYKKPEVVAKSVSSTDKYIII